MNAGEIAESIKTIDQFSSVKNLLNPTHSDMITKVQIYPYYILKKYFVVFFIFIAAKGPGDEKRI